MIPVRDYQLLEKVLTTQMTGVAIVDKTGSVLKANSCFWQLLNVQENAGEDISIRRFLADVRFDLAVFRTSNEIYPRSGGKRIYSWEIIRISAAAASQPVFLVYVNDTLSDAGSGGQSEGDIGRQQMEAQLLKQAQLLDMAEQANSTKSEFLATISHEIRTPMNIIVGMVDLLLATDLSEQQWSYLHLLQDATDGLLILINDVLDYSKIDAGKMDLQKVNFSLHDVVIDVVRLYAKKAEKRQIILDFNIHPVIQAAVCYGDRIRVKQVLMNLVDNAIKFTGGGSVHICVSLKTSEKKKYICFEVIDTGMGISQEHLQKLFLPFSQIDNYSTCNYNGSGLGLAISKRMVELMGGTIAVSSQKGIGSTFWFTIPFELSENPSLAAASTTGCQHTMSIPAGLLQQPVMVVEDNIVNRDLLTLQLEHMGFSTVHLADNGQHALEKAQKNDYLLILMDCYMPVMDGYEAARQIRSYERRLGKRPTLIIAVTANAMPGDIEKCKNAGMDDYLSKPVKTDHIRQLILRLIDVKLLTGTANRPAAAPGDEILDPAIIDDLLELQQQTGQPVLERVINIFFSSSPSVKQAIFAAAETKDPQALVKTAHSLKSSSASIGARRLAALCGRIESQARSGIVSNIAAHIVQLEEEYQQACMALQHIIETTAD